MEKNTAVTAGARSPQPGAADVHRRAMVVLLCVSVLAIGAWVYDHVGPGFSAEPTTAQVLQAEARAFAASTVAGDWETAYGYMTLECQAAKSPAEFQADIEVGMQMAQSMGLDLTRVVITDVQVRGVTATAGEVLTIGEVDGARLTDEEVWNAWVLQEGSWRSTDCPDNGDVATDPLAPTDGVVG